MEAPERLLKAELVAIRAELPDYLDADMLEGVVTSCASLPGAEVPRFLGDFFGALPSLPRIVQAYLASRSTPYSSSSASGSSSAQPSSSAARSSAPHPARAPAPLPSAGPHPSGGSHGHSSGVPGPGQGRGNPASVLGPVLQAYVKPQQEQGEHHRDTRRGGGGKHQGGGGSQQQGGEGGGSGQGVGGAPGGAQSGAPGRSRKGGKKKILDLSELDQGSVVFAQGQPCECQAARHGLVNNCLGCGRVVCEQEGEGPCAFCGRLVARHGSELALLEEQSILSEPTSRLPDPLGTDQANQQQQQQQGQLGQLIGHQGLSASQQGQQDEATRKAIAFKDRLVEYDRTSAQRTAVIDDQSDYFEIDGDSWLTDDERALLRRREEEKRKADEDRRRKVVVTFDLIGRRVMLQDPAAGVYVGVPGAHQPSASPHLPQFQTEGAPPLGAPGDAQFNGATSSGGGFGSGSHQQQFPPGAGATNGVPGVHPGGGEGSSGLGILSPLGAPAPAQSEGGGGGDVGFRMAPSPNLRMAAPVFTGALPSVPAADSAPAGRAQGGNGSGAGGDRKGAPHANDGGMAKIRSTRDAPRVQHEASLGASLGRALGTVSSSSAVTQSGAGSAQSGQGPFDLCSGTPGADGALPPLVRPRLGAAGAALGQGTEGGTALVLQEGMVLLKGWLSLAQQVEIVTACRELGLGPGGFYVPKLGSGAEMRLRMMCLGKHWEPNLHAYETTRSFFDNAVPPQIPDRFHALAGAALEAGQQRDPRGLPTMTPQVCIVNFYSGGGTLGMHQDKDEGIGSVRRGAPVVSFSIGDSAVFLYGRERLAETASKVILESGDVLVFGGPSRLVFHGVPEVLPHTAPPELLAATGLRPGRLNLTFREL